MNTLEKILKQDLVVSEEHFKLSKLKDRYVSENAIYQKGDIVLFDQYRYGLRSDRVIGRIERVHYNNTIDGLIEYCIYRVNKDGSDNKRDQSFYYKNEKQIIKKL